MDLPHPDDSGWGVTCSNNSGKEGGRDDTINEFGHCYTRVGGSVNPGICNMMEYEVHALIRERLHSKRSHDFRTADAIREKLANAGIQINDKTNEWKTDGRTLWGGADMQTCLTSDEMIQKAFANLKAMSPRDLAEFWAVFSSILQTNPDASALHHQYHQEMTRRLNLILAKTIETLDLSMPIDLATLALGLGSVVKHVAEYGQRIPNTLSQTLGEIFLDRKETMFGRLARCCYLSIHLFDERCLSNLAFGYAQAACIPKLDDGKTLFDCIATASVKILATFTTEHMASMVWAFEQAKVSSSVLFERVADNILVSDRLNTFQPPELANIVWAFGRANSWTGKGQAKSLSHFLGTIVDHIVALDNSQLVCWRLRDLAKILVAFASATVESKSDPLFGKLANVFIGMQKEDFSPQDVAFILSAYATAGNVDNQSLFTSMKRTAKSKIDGCNCQDLANIAWSYAVVNVPAASLFDAHFLRACLKKEDKFNHEGKSQLYQWHLWQEEHQSDIKLPLTTSYKFREAFVVQPPTKSSPLVSVLEEMGYQPEKAVPTPKGYFLDTLVVIDTKDFAIEIDWEKRFTGRKPTGKTVLRRRQITRLEGINLLSIPYWEWDRCAHGKDPNQKQVYLRSLLKIEQSSKKITEDGEIQEDRMAAPNVVGGYNIKVEESD